MNDLYNCRNAAEGRLINKTAYLDQLPSDVHDLVPCAVFHIRFTGKCSAVIPFASKNLLDIVGLDPLDVELDAAPFLNKIHPEDIEGFFLTAAKSAESMKLWCAEFRIDHVIKGKVWIEWRACPARKGEDIIWKGVALDITERKTMESSLRIATSVFDTAGEGIIITDQSGFILDVNPAFTKITGYSYNEAIGNNPRLLSSGEHDDSLYGAMWSSLKKKGFWSGEVINRRKNGERYTEHLNIMAVRDNSGAVIHYIGIFTDISSLKNQEHYLRYMAYYDVLTNLPNRLLLTSQLNNAISGIRDTDRFIGVLYLDLDGFKPVNDNYGHEIGDRVLIEVSRRLSEQVRSSDTVARIGGDEFVVLLTGIPDVEECAHAADRLLKAMAHPIELGDILVKLTVSIGICLHDGENQDGPDTLLRRADQSMCLAKSGGRDQYVFYENYMTNDSWKNDQTIHDIRLALKESQFAVYYQPIVDLGTGRVIKAEALVRWLHPKLGMVLPSEFITVAENGGLINEIGDLVFRNAVRVAHVLNSHDVIRNDGKLQISVNRSPRQFYYRDGVNNWIRYLEEQNISGELLAVEITEGLLLDNWPDILKQLNLLRDVGVSVSLDDFGTGYSALSYLTKFKIDFIKVDRAFVDNIAKDADYKIIVNSIINMAQQLGIETIGEGVETQEQADFLMKAGCNMAQGYLYAKPMPEDEFKEFVINNRRVTQVS